MKVQSKRELVLMPGEDEGCICCSGKNLYFMLNNSELFCYNNSWTCIFKRSKVSVHKTLYLKFTKALFTCRINEEFLYLLVNHISLKYSYILQLLFLWWGHEEIMEVLSHVGPWPWSWQFDSINIFFPDFVTNTNTNI